MAQYLTAQEASDKWGITKRRVQNLCVDNRIPGAFRLGNMWVIPADASKPKDARIRERAKEPIPIGVVIRKARRALKVVAETSISEFRYKGLSYVESMQSLVVMFASMLLENLGINSTCSLELCEKFFDYRLTIPVSNKVKGIICKYISENSLCLDDSLSWVYQFATKKSEEFKYNDTQFFTEKYMISTLVDSIHIERGSKIIDPACGGGNFLLYSFDIFVEKTPKKDAFSRAVFALENLYGYEIDSFLAYVGAFNLKFKALMYVRREREITIDDFAKFHPLIFHPKYESVSGFLDTKWELQHVINCDSREELQLIDAFDGANVVITNPPFRTIKGMPLEQKDYLQKFYPMAKCDMCNAFIERVMKVLPAGGKAAMVTQNSWMYLDSFTSLREMLLSEYTLNCIWELGPNAFYDLSGEKANVVLMTATKEAPIKSHKIELGLLRTMGIEQIENVLKSGAVQTLHVRQIDVLKNKESRFDMVSTDHLKFLQTSCAQYKNFAVPMQGTSTGDAKNLIDYYWKHIEDEEWILVSKGGGYSRFEGLNSYCVKWGKDGEYIKNTKGSAIRNAKYFSETQLVYSDTGTAGLNVRVLLPGQIFVASGPGIRITKGKSLAHLAFLNSRFAAFYVRLLSPKLTIAAGYIGKIPVTDSILESKKLEKYAELCLESKKHRLSKRPNNYEFSYVKHPEGKNISDMAEKWFQEDIRDEWTQLLNEQKIEDYISAELELTTEDNHAIDDYIGQRIIKSNETDAKRELSAANISGILGYDCLPRRTKASKKSLGVDGLIEYISQIYMISCEKVCNELKKHFEWVKNDYNNLYIHALVLSALKFKENEHEDNNIEILLPKMGITDADDKSFVRAWIKSEFYIVHSGVFGENPLYCYDSQSGKFKRIEK